MKDKKQIVAAIATIAKNSAKLRDQIQTTLVDINCHVVEFGEPSLYQKLIDATQGANRVGIHKWIAENGFAVFRNGKFEMNKSALANVRNGAKTAAECLAARMAYFDDLADNPLPVWYEEAQSTEDADVAKVWDALAKAEEFLVTLAKKDKKGEAQHADLDRFLRKAIAEYKAQATVGAEG